MNHDRIVRNGQDVVSMTGVVDPNNKQLVMSIKDSLTKPDIDEFELGKVLGQVFYCIIYIYILLYNNDDLWLGKLFYYHACHS